MTAEKKLLRLAHRRNEKEAAWHAYCKAESKAGRLPKYVGGPFREFARSVQALEKAIRAVGSE